MYMYLNKVYEFDLGDMSHSGMSHDEMCEHYRCNSSPLSFLMEKLLPKWFVNLVYDSTPLIIECNGQPIKIKPDLRDKETRTILYDQKHLITKVVVLNVVLQRVLVEFIIKNLMTHGQRHRRLFGQISLIYRW